MTVDDAFRTFSLDIWYAWRRLWKKPGATLAASLSLALGIGVNTVVFSLINALVLAKLPVHDPERLVMFDRMSKDSDDSLFSYHELQMLQSSSNVLAGLTGASSVFRSSIRTDSPIVDNGMDGVEAQLVTTDFFSVLGVSPAIGRVFTSEDAAVGKTPVAVISHGYWTRRFGANPTILGRGVVVGGVSVVIVGVAPKGFWGLSVGLSPDLWLPLSTQPLVRFAGELRAEPGGNPNFPWVDQDPLYWLRLTGRLPPAVSLERASAELSGIFRAILTVEAAKTGDAGYRNRLLSQRLKLEAGARGRSDLRTRLSMSLFVLMALVVIVLLNSCANVANLQLARSRVERKEVAIRLAIGAQASRILRLLLVESILLALIGQALGLLLAFWTSRLLIASESIPPALAFQLDRPTLLFTSAMSVLAVVIFGLIPASTTLNVDLATAYRDGGRGTVGQGWAVSSRAPIILQLTGALVLTIGASLLVLTQRNLQSRDTGYANQSLLVGSIDPDSLHLDQAGFVDLYRRILDSLESTPGVRSAAIALNGALTGNARFYTISVAGHVPRPDENPNVLGNNVTPGYFETMGISVLQGRTFQPSDRMGALAVAIINDAMAKFYFPGRSAIGQTFGIGGISHARDLKIIGVVRSVSFLSLRGDVRPMFYICAYQAPEALREIEVATLVPPRQIRRALAASVPALPLYTLTSFRERVRESTFFETLIARVTGFFSILSLVLASIGVYGLMSYTVARRTNEIGLRIAFGANRSGVIWLVIREVIILLGFGIAAGLCVAIALARFMSTLVFGISSADPATMAVSTFIIAIVAILAGTLPALRASRVDPIKALQHE